jgi:hypothetical protein
MSPVAVVRDSGGTVVQRRTAIWEGKITERYDGIDYTYPIVEVYEFDNDPETADRGLLNRPSVQADVLLRVLQRRGTEGNLETLPENDVSVLTHQETTRDAQTWTTEQKVGSSNISGRATVFPGHSGVLMITRAPP